MRVLFYTEVPPFPTYGGERLRVYHLIKALSKVSDDVHVVINNQYAVNLSECEIKNVTYHELSNSRSARGSFRKALYYFRRDPEATRLLCRILESLDIDVVFLDYGFVGHYITYLKRNCGCHVVYSTHNAQSYLSSQESVSSVLSHVRRFIIVSLQSAHERFYFNKADTFMVVSEQDRIFHEKFVASCKIVVIPNFIDMSLYETRIERADYIVMSANFGANHNVVGLNWFLDHVWDDELANITRFVIAGLRSREALQERGGAWGVEALGEVDNIRDVIARAQCAVVPLLHGSGTRFKCIEAMALKIPLVSTSVGAEGLAHGGTILLADTPNSFKEALLNVLRRPQEHRVRTEVAYKICQELYSLTPNQQRLSDVLARCRRSDDGGSGH